MEKNKLFLKFLTQRDFIFRTINPILLNPILYFKSTEKEKLLETEETESRSFQFKNFIIFQKFRIIRYVIYLP